MESNIRICIVCSKPNSCYKCPQCSKSYCSVTCCQSHKSDQCRIADQATASDVRGKDSNFGQASLMDYPTEDTVPIEKLRLLETSNDLKSLIRSNARLQHLLRSIDRSSDPSIALKMAMKQDQNFQHFASICMRIVKSDSEETAGRSEHDELAHLLIALSEYSEMPVSRDQIGNLTSLLHEHLSDDDDISETVLNRK